MKDDQKYRKANARNLDLGQLGKAKIRAAKNIVDKGKLDDNEGTVYGLRNEGADMLGASYGRSIGDTGADVGAYKKGGMMKEGSAKDTREDKAQAKKRGMTMAQWEKSDADKKHDTAGMKRGGKVAKAMCGGSTKKMATGGSVRGTGAAIRGKGYSGEF